MKKHFIVNRQEGFLTGFAAIILVTLVYLNEERIVNWVAPLFRIVFSSELTARSVFVQRVTLIPIILIGTILFFLFQRLIGKLYSRYHGARIVLIVLLAAILTTSLFFFVRISLYMRPVVDDYMNIVITRTQTLWEKSVSYYDEWSGRYMGPSITYLYTIIPYRILIPLFPIFIILLLLLGLYQLSGDFLKQITNSDQWTNRIMTTVVLTAVLGFGTLLLTPSIFSSVYWFAGGTVYGLGLALSLLSFAQLFNSLKTEKYGWQFLLILILPILTCGTNELTAVSMCIFGFSIWLWQMVFNRKSPVLKKKALWFLLICIGCTAFSFVAPGNRARMTEHPVQIRTSITDWVFHQMIGGMAGCFQGFWQSVMEHKTVLLLMILCCFLTGTFFHLNSKRIQLILWTAVTAAVTSFFCFITNATVMWAPERSVITPTAWVLITFGLVSFLIGSLFGKVSSIRVYFPSLLFCGILVFSICIQFYSDNIERVKQFSAESDYREAQLFAADPAEPVTVSCKVPLLFDELEDLLADPSFWVNEAMADFFGLNSLTAYEDCSLFLISTTESTVESR